MSGRFSRGGALPMPFRRTFASAILAFTHSTETSLRLPGCAQFPTPLDWHGQHPSPIFHPEKNRSVETERLSGSRERERPGPRYTWRRV